MMHIEDLNIIYQYFKEPIEKLDILIVAAHPDDAELGCGGLILKARDAGYTVGIVDITNGEPTPYGTPEMRVKEAILSAEAFDINMRLILGFKNRYLEDSEEARINIAQIYRIFRPEIVFSHFPNDAHPDHIVASHIAKSARFYAKYTKTNWAGEPYYVPRLYNFYALHLRTDISPSFIVPIDTENFERKMKNIMKSYKSQFKSNKFNSELLKKVEGYWKYWGLLSHSDYGEPFYSEEKLIIQDISTLFLQ